MFIGLINNTHTVNFNVSFHVVLKINSYLFFASLVYFYKKLH